MPPSLFHRLSWVRVMQPATGILTATQKFGFCTASLFTKQAYGKNGCNNKSLKLYMKFDCLTWKNNNDPRLVYDMETNLGASSVWPYLQYLMYLQKYNIYHKKSVRCFTMS